MNSRIVSAVAAASLSVALVGCSDSSGSESPAAQPSSATSPTTAESAPVMPVAETDEIFEGRDVDSHDWDVPKVRFDLVSKGLLNDGDEKAVAKAATEWFTTMSFMPGDIVAHKVADSEYERIRPLITPRMWGVVQQVAADIRATERDEDADVENDHFDLRVLTGFGLGNDALHGEGEQLLLDPTWRSIRVSNYPTVGTVEVEGVVDVAFWLSEGAREEAAKEPRNKAAAKYREKVGLTPENRPTAVRFKQPRIIYLTRDASGRWLVDGWKSEEGRVDYGYLPGSPVGEYGAVKGEEA